MNCTAVPLVTALGKASLTALSLLIASAASAEPVAYPSPDTAIAAVIDALEARDGDALVAAFGPEHRDLILTGERDRDVADWTRFYEAYNTNNRIGIDGDTATLFIGEDEWPTLIPIVRGEDGTWRFDAEAGRDEILSRRIGENELDVISLLRAYVGVQADYRQIDYDGDGVMEFASTSISDDGERNGLYWPSEPGTPDSPVGDFVARAAADGHSVGDQDAGAEPLHGYYFRILSAQGDAAPGGAYDYSVGGNMIGGHAMVAFPSAYGETGIMTLMVGENGIVYEADLGEDTLELGDAMTAYNPDENWSVVE